MAGGTVLRSSARRLAVKLCGAVSVVNTSGPRSRSCSGTQIMSAVPIPVLGSCITTVKVAEPARRRSARM